MLLAAGSIPQNSQRPLSADYWTQNDRDMYSVFSAGLTAQNASQCIPGPEAFMGLDPAGGIIGMTTPNVASPALSTAVSGPSPVSPLASQVAKVQAAMRAGLTSRSPALGAAVIAQGQAGAPSGDYSNAAEVLPMGTTPNMAIEKNPALRTRRASSPPSPRGVPWGAAPGPACGNGGVAGLSMGQILFFLAGALVIGVAVVE